MVENSPAGLAMLGAEVAVAVTGEEHHQAVLARYPVAPGQQRHVAVELCWCTIGSGKHRGQPAIEVRLDGQRVGELTHLMSQRYARILTDMIAQGHRPGCEAVIQRGAKGWEVVLRLPNHTNAAIPAPPAPPRRGVFSAHRPAWIAAAVVGVIIVAALLSNNDDSPTSSPNPASQLDTSTTAPVTTTTPAPTTTTPPTTPTAVAPPPNPPPVQPPAPRTTTTKQAPPPPPPAPPKPKPQPACDPNYTGCVPIASDVDCEGGSGNGPAYVKGPIQVIGNDIYDLDRDKDGTACE